MSTRSPVKNQHAQWGEILSEGAILFSFKWGFKDRIETLMLPEYIQCPFKLTF